MIGQLPIIVAHNRLYTSNGLVDQDKHGKRKTNAQPIPLPPILDPHGVVANMIKARRGIYCDDNEVQAFRAVREAG